MHRDALFRRRVRRLTTSDAAIEERTATSPERVPFMDAIRSKDAEPVLDLVKMILHVKAEMQAAAEDRKVFTAHNAAMSAWYGLLLPKERAEPGLNPNHPNQRMNVPSS
jgi:hypothetical protein